MPTFDKFLQREEPIKTSGPWVPEILLLVVCPSSLSSAGERNPQTLMAWLSSPDIVMVFQDEIHFIKACDGRSL